MTDAVERDYRTSLESDGLFDPNLLPRANYMATVFDLHETTDEAVHALRTAQPAYDMDQLIERVEAKEGVTLPPAAAAQHLFGASIEREWWDATHVLEHRLRRLVADHPRRRTAHVDPAYDCQGHEGWRRLRRGLPAGHSGTLPIETSLCYRL